jgi:hypothetical protein
MSSRHRFKISLATKPHTTMTNIEKPKREKPPPVLYRYRPPEEVVRHRYLEDLLTHNRIWATSPARFNDPFDCRASFSFDGSEQEWRRFLNKREEQYSGLPRSRRRQAVNARIKDRFWTDSAAQTEILAGFQGSLDNSSILCLCESETHPLMWAHYAGGHRGVCLRFDTAAIPFSMAFRVIYAKGYPVVNVMGDAGEQIQACVLTKASWWRYEREWRVVAYQRKEGYWDIAPDALKAVILGMKADKKLVDEVRRLCSSLKSSVEVLQAAPAPNTYELQVLHLP